MNKKNKEQAKHFIKAARGSDCSEDEIDVDRELKVIAKVSVKTPPSNSKA